MNLFSKIFNRNSIVKYVDKNIESVSKLSNDEINTNIIKGNTINIKLISLGEKFKRITGVYPSKADYQVAYEMCNKHYVITPPGLENKFSILAASIVLSESNNIHCYFISKAALRNYYTFAKDFYEELGLDTCILKSEYNIDNFNHRIVCGYYYDFGINYLESRISNNKEDKDIFSNKLAIFDEFDSLLYRNNVLIKLNEIEHFDLDLYNEANSIVKSLKGGIGDIIPLSSIEDNYDKYDYYYDTYYNDVKFTYIGYKKIDEAFKLDNFKDTKSEDVVKYIRNIIIAKSLIEYCIEDNDIVAKQNGKTKVYGEYIDNDIKQIIRIINELEVKDNIAAVSAVSIIGLIDIYAESVGLCISEYANFKDFNVTTYTINADYNKKANIVYFNKNKDESIESIYNFIIGEIKKSDNPVIVFVRNSEIAESLSNILDYNKIEHSKIIDENILTDVKYLNAGLPKSVTLIIKGLYQGVKIKPNGDKDSTILNGIRTFDYSPLKDEYEDENTYYSDLEELRYRSLYWVVNNRKNKLAIKINSSINEIINNTRIKDDATNECSIYIIYIDNYNRCIDYSRIDDLAVYGDNFGKVCKIMSHEKHVVYDYIQMDRVFQSSLNRLYNIKLDILNTEDYNSILKSVIKIYVDNNIIRYRLMDSIESNDVLNRVFESDFLVSDNEPIKDFNIAMFNYYKSIETDNSELNNEYIIKIALSCINKAIEEYCKRMEFLRENIYKNTNDTETKFKEIEQSIYNFVIKKFADDTIKLVFSLDIDENYANKD